MLFCSKFPALVNKDGKPRNWRVFVLGMTHLSRDRSRQVVDSFRASSAAGSYGPEREQWVKEQLDYAGWS